VHAERLIERAEARRCRVSEALDKQHRAAWGQFFTPSPVATFLADLIDLPEAGRFVVLDPGAGTGSLAAAVAAKAVAGETRCALHIVAFEADPSLSAPLAATLRDCERTASRVGIEVTTEVHELDFLAWASASLAGSVFAGFRQFDACIMNPPYRKVGTGSPDRLALERIGLRVTNLYPAFLGAASALLGRGGQLSAITPRSFANGPYFLPFRRFFLSLMAIDFLHVYERRGKLFADAGVLQENVVFRAVRGGPCREITLSRSAGLADARSTRRVPAQHVVDPDDPNLFVHIPLDEEATHVAARVAALPATLAELGIEVSTGRVVDFRTKDNLIHEPDGFLAPLIYPGHLCSGRVIWPQLDGRKPNALTINADTLPLLLPIGNYVLVKRFTSKEERRRIVAATFRPADVGSRVVAFENHLNVFHRRGRGLEPALADGLAAFLNSSTIDAYVRQFSGHTQINATDLRLLRYPDIASLLRLGAASLDEGFPEHQDALDALVASHVEGFDADHQVRHAA
jgi:adenine-specific DNA-methyltransferase